MSSRIRTPPGWDAFDFSTGLARLEARMAELGPASPGVSHPLADDLVLAYEELRVADEEIRAQQEHVDSLLAGGQRLARQHERVFALLPVPVVTTDEFGIIRVANQAAAGLLGLSLSRLVGKPLAAFVAAEDRSELRGLFSGRVREGERLHLRMVVLSREGHQVGADAVATALPGESLRLTWVLLPEGQDGSMSGALPLLPDALAGLAGLAAQDPKESDLLHEVATLTGHVFGPSAAVSVCLGGPLEPVAVATSSARSQHFDGAQSTAGEGPGPTAYESGSLAVSGDLAADRRWPRLRDRLPAESVAAASAPLEIGTQVVGVLTVYTDPARGGPDVSAAVGLLAAGISAVLSEVRTRTELRAVAGQLESALASRAVIDQAKGIVMADRRCSADEAFEHLLHLSSVRHVKVREVARELVNRASGQEAP